MMKCLIVEDEPLARDVLVKYITDHPNLKLSGIAKDAFEGERLLKDQQVDVMFLDINMPKINGLSFYRGLKKKPPVIFTTAYPDYAVEGFEVEAVDYLVKPFSFERFALGVAKVKVEERISNERLAIKTEKKTYRLKPEDIRYVESIGNYVKIHTAMETLISHDTLKELTSRLLPSGFLRVHKSYLINLDVVDYMEGNQLVIGTEKIPIGYSYRESVSNVFQ